MAAAVIPQAQAAGAQLGGTCKKVGAKATVSRAPLVCTKIGKKLIWQVVKYVPPKAAPVLLPAEDDPKIIAAAKAEGGKVSFYCAITLSVCKSLGLAFTNRYGIGVDVLRVVSAEMTTRYTAEKKSGAPTADVLLSSDVPFATAALASGDLTSFAKAGILEPTYPKDFIAPGLGMPFEYEVWGICYNTKLVAAADVPQSWTDLTLPKWKGKMNGPSPTVSPAVAVGYGTIQEYLKDPTFIKKLGGQEIKQLAGGMIAATAALGAGEASIQAVCNAGSWADAKAKGAPIEITFPPGATGPPFLWSLNSKSPRPNAQKLFGAYVISREGGQVLLASSPYSANAFAKPAFEVISPNFGFFDAAKQKQVLTDLGL